MLDEFTQEQAQVHLGCTASTDGRPTVPTPEREELRRELSRIVEQLSELPPDAFTERVRLRDLQSSLRALLAEPTEGRTRESLETELEQLTKRLERLLEERPNVGAMSDGGQGGDGLAQSQQMAWDYDAGQGRGDMEQRIREIRRALEAWTSSSQDD